MLILTFAAYLWLASRVPDEAGLEFVGMAAHLAALPQRRRRIAIILALSFHRWSAIALAVLFAVQFGVPDTAGRYILSIVHLGIAAVVLLRHRRDILPTLAAPFRRSHGPAAPAQAADLPLDARQP